MTKKITMIGMPAPTGFTPEGNGRCDPSVDICMNDLALRDGLSVGIFRRHYKEEDGSRAFPPEYIVLSDGPSYGEVGSLILSMGQVESLARALAALWASDD
jgi:hypothetical protein